MALVKRIERSQDRRHALHPTTTACMAFLVDAIDGQRLLQLETYGSRGRKLPGKTSQTLQFSHEALLQLKELVEEALR